jgi:hypothetical protein
MNSRPRFIFVENPSIRRSLRRMRWEISVALTLLLGILGAIALL